MASGRPGKFPAKLVAVAKGLVTLDAKAEDTEYLVPFEGQMVIVDITPTSSSAGEPSVGGEPDPNATPPLPNS